MKFKTNTFKSISQNELSKALNDFRNDMYSDKWGGIEYANIKVRPDIFSIFNYINITFRNLKVDSSKLFYYGILFMFDKMKKGEIDEISLVQTSDNNHFENTDSKLLGSTGNESKNLDIEVDNKTEILLADIGNLIRLKNAKIKYNSVDLGTIVILNYIINCNSEFIEFVKNHKLVESSIDMTIYQMLRWKKLKKDMVCEKINFNEVFDQYLISKQLPSISDFKEAYTYAKNNYITISDFLKTWKRKNKKLLSCYINEDEKQYLEYMLLSNTVNYKELKKFIYSK